MNRLFIIFICLILSSLYAGTYEVPMGIPNNQIIISIHNNRETSLSNCSVELEEAPDWFTLESLSPVTIDSLGPGLTHDAVFSFSIEKGESERAGTVTLLVKDQKGQSLGRREYDLITALKDPSLTLFPSYPNPANPSATIQYSLPDADIFKKDLHLLN